MVAADATTTIRMQESREKQKKPVLNKQKKSNRTRSYFLKSGARLLM